MTERQKQLRDWFLTALLMVAVSVVVGVVNRYLGIRVEVPPPPPVTVIVEPGGDQPKVTVTRTP